MHTIFHFPKERGQSPSCHETHLTNHWWEQRKRYRRWRIFFYPGVSFSHLNKSLIRENINQSSEGASSHHPGDMQAETCCSLPRSSAICSTDCAETHTASAAASPLGERVTRGSAATSMGLFLFIRYDCSYRLHLCWLGSLSTDRTNNVESVLDDKTENFQFV